MDEMVRRRGIWIGLGVLALITLCVMACGLGAMFFTGAARDPIYVQPPAAEEGFAPPPAYHGYGPLTAGRHAGGPFSLIFAGIGFFFKLAFFGLFLLLLLGLVKRLFWGRRCWGRHYRGRPPEGKEWKGKPHHMWGPWAWHMHAERWGPEAGEAEASEGEGEPDQEDLAYGEAE
jgi:hypothetical protein